MQNARARRLCQTVGVGGHRAKECAQCECDCMHHHSNHVSECAVSARTAPHHTKAGVAPVRAPKGAHRRGDAFMQTRALRLAHKSSLGRSFTSHRAPATALEDNHFNQHHHTYVYHVLRPYRTFSSRRYLADLRWFLGAVGCVSVNDRCRIKVIRARRSWVPSSAGAMRWYVAHHCGLLISIQETMRTRRRFTMRQPTIILID